MTQLDDARRSFDLRTLLTNVNGFAELLADPTLEIPMERRLEYAEIILASGERLSEQVAAWAAKIALD